MPSEGSLDSKFKKKPATGSEKQEIVSTIRDSLEFASAKDKIKAQKESAKKEREALELKVKEQIEGKSKKAKKANIEPIVSKLDAVLKTESSEGLSNKRDSKLKSERNVDTTFERPSLKDEIEAEQPEHEDDSTYTGKIKKAFVRPKVDYKFSYENRLNKNRTFRGYAAHRKVTKVEYQDAIKQYQKNQVAARREAVKDRGTAPEYTATDYIRLKKEASDAVSPIRFRAIRAHRTTIVVISSLLFFELTARFKSKAWREQSYKLVLKKNAKRIYNTVIKVQGLFIKFGQLISVISYAIPEEFREELEALQDKVPQRSVENIIKRIESDLGRPIDRVFSHFNAEALAAASLAQVHEATLITGERVAVKVQHIGIEQEVKADLRTFNQITRLTDFFLSVNGLKRAQEQITRSVMDELDYVKEEKHLNNFYKNFADEKSTHVPKVYSKFCSEHVLVMEYVEGIKANDYKKLDQLDIDKKLVAKRIIEAFCQMVFKDGLIHGDPHPGNILVNVDASITLIDFGSVVELNPILRQGIIDLVFGGLTHNTRRIMSGLRKVKYLTPHADEALVEKLIDYVYEFILEGGLSLDNFSLNDINFNQDLAGTILKDLHHLDISYSEIKNSFQLPQDVMMMGRMLMMLGGLVYEIDPELKPFDIIRPYLQKFIFSGGGNLQGAVRDSAIGFGMGAMQTIDNARYVIDKAKRGDLQINVKDERKRRYLHYYLFQQFISILMATGSSVMSYYVWLQGDLLSAQIGALVTAGFLWSAVKATKAAKNFRR
jgi:predicted unusual protein kinase regulating ubiquinone biosynthesis (AarF/ABC1/UbiB family)